MSLVADELPEGWCVAAIDQLCDLNPKHDSSLKANLPVSFVPMAAVSEVDGRITTPEVRPLGEVKKGFTHFADGDVVLAKITPCMENGKAASVRGMVNGLACGTTEFFVFRSRGAIDQDYLFKFIRQESFRRAARATMQSGVGQARVPKEFVLETEIPLAPLPEQRRIVAKIEALQSRSRKAREALEAIPPLLEQFRQSVLAAAFRGDLTADWREQHPNVEPASVLLDRIRAERRRKWEQAELAKFKAKGKKPNDDSWKEKYVEPEPVDDTDLPELPEGWCWARLDDICFVQGGFAFKSSDYQITGVPLIRIGDLNDGFAVTSQSTVRLPTAFLSDYDQFKLNNGDLLIAMSGATTGKTAVYENSESALLNQRVGRFVPRSISHLHHPYLRCLIESIAEGVRSRAYGGAQPNISPSEIASTVIALPRNRSDRGEQGRSSILAELGLHGLGQPVEYVAVLSATGLDHR